jgi:hypothetical protein
VGDNDTPETTGTQHGRASHDAEVDRLFRQSLERLVAAADAGGLTVSTLFSAEAMRDAPDDINRVIQIHGLGGEYVFCAGCLVKLPRPGEPRSSAVWIDPQRPAEVSAALKDAIILNVNDYADLIGERIALRAEMTAAHDDLRATLKEIIDTARPETPETEPVNVDLSVSLVPDHVRRLADGTINLTTTRHRELPRPVASVLPNGDVRIFHYREVREVLQLRTHIVSRLQAEAEARRKAAEAQARKEAERAAFLAEMSSAVAEFAANVRELTASDGGRGGSVTLQVARGWTITTYGSSEAVVRSPKRGLGDGVTVISVSNDGEMTVVDEAAARLFRSEIPRIRAGLAVRVKAKRERAALDAKRTPDELALCASLETQLRTLRRYRQLYDMDVAAGHRGLLLGENHLLLIQGEKLVLEHDGSAIAEIQVSRERVDVHDPAAAKSFVDQYASFASRVARREAFRRSMDQFSGVGTPSNPRAASSELARAFPGQSVRIGLRRYEMASSEVPGSAPQYFIRRMWELEFRRHPERARAYAQIIGSRVPRRDVMFVVRDAALHRFAARDFQEIVQKLGGDAAILG